MKIGQSKSDDEKLVTEQGVRQSKQVKHVRETEEKSITSVSTVPVVWIMFGLLLSLVTQTGLGNRRDHE